MRTLTTQDTVPKDEYGRKLPCPIQPLSVRECMCCERNVCGKCSDACKEHNCQNVICTTNSHGLVQCNTRRTYGTCSKHHSYKYKDTDCDTCRSIIENVDGHDYGPDPTTLLCHKCYPDNAKCGCGKPSIYSHFDTAPQARGHGDSDEDNSDCDSTFEDFDYYEEWRLGCWLLSRVVLVLYSRASRSSSNLAHSKS
jgi:hypothetical protein